MQQPLADYVRPQTLDEVVGQRHILGENGILRNLVKSGHIPNLIFYGPSGTGKTTVANIIAKETNRRFFKLNATNASVSDIKEIVAQLDTLMTQNGILLYLDEIQNFNKKQQQSLLEYIENGQITLIASTTENPYFYIYNAILSRCSVFEFKQVEPQEVLRGLTRVVKKLPDFFGGKQFQVTDEALSHMAYLGGGDVRKSINLLELAALSKLSSAEDPIVIDLETAEQSSQSKALRYDRDGDSHYDVLSAFQKSIRGSDVNAGLHYLARLIAGGDLISICRRLLVIASEDVGMAYPMAAVITASLCESAHKLGFPEAKIPLSQAVILLATAPKSNSCVEAISRALSDVEQKNCGDVPDTLKDAHYGGAQTLGRGKGYKYAHAYPHNYVRQQYLPDAIKDAVYYTYGNNQNEQKIRRYWEELLKQPDIE